MPAALPVSLGVTRTMPWSVHHKLRLDSSGAKGVLVGRKFTVAFEAIWQLYFP
jgi:hypothetical protein